MAFSWQKVMENSGIPAQIELQRRIEETNAKTKAIQDAMAARTAAELAGKIAQTNTKATGTAATDALVAGTKTPDAVPKNTELDGEVAQANAKASAYFQTRTLLSGALADDDSSSSLKTSKIDPFLSSGSEAQVRAKRRTTLIAG